MVINVTECNKDSIAQQPDPNGKILAISLCPVLYLKEEQARAFDW